jgi:hypothetical protein
MFLQFKKVCLVSTKDRLDIIKIDKGRIETLWTMPQKKQLS